MFTNSTIGRFFNLIGETNVIIRDNTTYKGTEGMSIACSQRNEYISNLFHNLKFIGNPIQENDANTAYYHVLTHINWFNSLTYQQLSVYKDIGVNIDELKALFETMKLELEPFIDQEVLSELLEQED